MFPRHSVAVAVGLGIVVSAALIEVKGAPASISVSTGVAIAVIALGVRWSTRDGRFIPSGPASCRVTALANAMILGAAMLGVLGINVDRTTRFSLQLLILAVGSVSVVLGCAATVLDADDRPATPDVVGRRGQSARATTLNRRRGRDRRVVGNGLQTVPQPSRHALKGVPYAPEGGAEGRLSGSGALGG